MNQNMIVMGANGGIGEALCLQLASAGYNVTATMRDPANASPALRAAVSDIRSADVTKPDTLFAAFEDFAASKPLAGFAYCVGSIDMMPLKAAKDEQYLQSFEINLLGAMRALRLLEKPLKVGGGSVVLYSSIAVDQGFSNHTVIGAAKGAVEGFARSLAAEWAGTVRVNVIAPSLTDTAIAKPLTSSAPMREAIEKMHPIPRLGMPDDIAALSAFLMGPQSGWITGQIYRADGGRSTLRPKG